MKLIKNLLIAVIVIAMLFSVSCSESNITESNTEQCSVYPGVYAEFGKDHKAGDFQVSVESINLNYTSASITLEVTNPTNKIASCDKSFEVEKLHDGHWETCKIDEPTYSENEQGIPENSSSTVTYDFGTAFAINEPGTYRFVTNIFKDAVGTREKINLTIEFTVVFDTAYPTLDGYQISEGSVIITVTWNNNSEHALYLTDAYSVEVSNSEGWAACERTENEFPLAIYAIAPGEKATRTYVVEEMYQLNSFGNFRMYLEYAVNDGEDSSSRVAEIDFFIPFEMEAEIEIVH